MKTLKRNLTALGLVIGMGGPLCVMADSSMDSTKAKGPTTLSSDDIEFFSKAAQTDMTEVQAAAIASSRALTVDTKSFASNMTTDHERNSDALHALAEEKGVILPTTLDSKHQSELDDLQKVDVKKFDVTYAEDMTKGHKDAVELYEKASKKSKDADIRSFAMNTLPTIQHHLDMAKHLNEKS